VRVGIEQSMDLQPAFSDELDIEDVVKSIQVRRPRTVISENGLSQGVHLLRGRSISELHRT
jgi:hypothetical protein